MYLPFSRVRNWGFRGGNAAAQLKGLALLVGVDGHGIGFRGGNAAAQLKVVTDDRVEDELPRFPRRRRRGSIEGGGWPDPPWCTLGGFRGGDAAAQLKGRELAAIRDSRS